MLYKNSLIFYNKYVKKASDNKLFLCRMELLFRNFIVPNIEVKKASIKQNKMINPKLYLVYLFLACYTLFNIFLLKLKKIDSAHYLIDIKNSKDFYDFRSKEVLEISPPQTSANFMHLNNAKYSLKTLHRKSNVIYFETIYYVLKPFLKTKRFEYVKSNNNFANEILEAHQEYYNDSYYIYKVALWILDFLNIKILISLDDTRYSNEINLASKDLNIKTIGYMHGIFNEYDLGVFEFPFDQYLVWSDYFKEKVLKLSNKYKQDNIEVIGHFRIKEKFEEVKEKTNILWLGESNINYEEVFPFINKLIEDGHKVYFKDKPSSNNKLSDFLQKNIIYDDSNSFFECLLKNNIGVVLGTHSTALMESWIVGVPSLVLKCSFDYGSHLWEDELIEICDNTLSLKSYIYKCLSLSKNELNSVRDKIWGKNYYFHKNKAISILTANDYEN
jgi:hypothetical protein